MSPNTADWSTTLRPLFAFVLASSPLARSLTYSASPRMARATSTTRLSRVETNIVNVYAPDCGKLIASLNDPYGNPSGAAVRGGTFYVEDLDGSIPVCTLSGCTSELTNPSIRSGSGGSVAVDSFGNVWAAVYDQTFRIALVVWPHAKMPGRVVTG